MHRIFRKPIVIIPVAFIAAGAALWVWHARHDSRLNYQTALVKRGDLVVTISASGTIEPVEVVDVGAQVAGRIISFGTDMDGKTIDYRSVVEEGAVLAKIDEFRHACEGLDEESSSHAPEGRWSPKQIISHLCGPEGTGHLPGLKAFLVSCPIISFT